MDIDLIREAITLEVDGFVSSAEATPLGRLHLREDRKVIAAWCHKDRVGWRWIPLLVASHTRSAAEPSVTRIQPAQKLREWSADRPRTITDARAALLNDRAEKLTGIPVAEAFAHSRQCDDMGDKITDAAHAKVRAAVAAFTR